MERRKGRNREDSSGRCLSIALHPCATDDSEQALDLNPNRRGSVTAGISAAKKKAPFTGLPEADSGMLARLLMAAAPLPSISRLRGEGKSVNQRFKRAGPRFGTGWRLEFEWL